MTLPDPEQEEADKILMALTGRPGCALCGELSINWAFTKVGPDGIRYKMCSGCVIAFRNKHNNIISTGEACTYLMCAIEDGLAAQRQALTNFFNNPNSTATYHTRARALRGYR